MEDLKKLQREEEKIYKRFEKYLKGKSEKEIQEFYKNLNEYVDVQIELEKFCGG